MNRAEKFLKLAYKHTFESLHSFPMAAVLADGRRVISIGINRTKTHPKQHQRVGAAGNLYGYNRPHAELDCLIRANYEDIAGSTIYIARRKKNMDLGIAKPCVICFDLLKKYKIKHIYYTVDHPILTSGVWYEHIAL